MVFCFLEVEKDSFCQGLIMKWFKGCVFGDIMSMISDKVPTKRLMKPEAVKFKETSYCHRHDQQCPCEFSQSEDSIGVLGAPCVLFTTKLGLIWMHGPIALFDAGFSYTKDWFGLRVLLRMGAKKGFKDIAQGQCHSVGTKAMLTLAANVHENVEGFDEVPYFYCCVCFSFFLVSTSCCSSTCRCRLPTRR